MSPLPVLLIFISSFTHAGWNLLARQRRDEVTFFRRMLLIIAPLAAALALAALALPHSFPPLAWLCVVVSGAICGVYMWFLAQAYRRSDFTVVYPVARALPVLMVVGVDLLRGRHPSAAGWGGMLLVVIGCVLAPQESWSGIDLRRYHLREVAWILLTAGSIAAFTLLDKVAQETMQQGPGSALLYCGVWHIIAAASYVLLHRGLAGTSAGREVGWRGPALAAVLGLSSYTLVLWAYQLSPQTGYLLALRQFSIVVGVAAAFLLHREAGAAVRLPATAAVVGGLIVLVLFG